MNEPASGEKWKADLIGAGKTPLGVYRPWVPGNSSGHHHESWQRNFRPFVEYAGQSDWSRAVTLSISHGSDGHAAFKDGFAARYSESDPPLHAVLGAMDALANWARQDGQISWTPDPAGFSRIGAMVPKELGRRIRHAALDADETISDFIVNAVSARLKNPPAAAAKGGAR